MENNKCFFCEKDATHYDVVINSNEYIVADVCLTHMSVSLTA